MKKILLISDTHSMLDEKAYKYFNDCDEIWHAGDIGNLELADQLSTIKPLKAVHGNIDDYKVRTVYPENLIFYCEGVKVFMTHIGGYPDRYNLEAKKIIEAEKPKLFICGHSHILKVMYDQKYQCLHMNPGACGHHGFHKKNTMLRFTISDDAIKDLEVIELGNRGDRATTT